MKGLDADTSTKCFSALLERNGLLRNRGTTVIMATHNSMQDSSFDDSTLANHNTKRNGFRMPIGSSY
jgi:ABC-type lipoprotein export system ATPase subunit